MSVLDQCVGKWPGILAALGIKEELLRNRQGPCPICGGKDRFRFDDKEGQGTWYCNSCGAGNGYTLLQKFKHWSPGEVLKALDKEAGNIAAAAPRRAISNERLNTFISELWASAKYPELALDYLRGRGLTLTALPASLRGAEAMPHPELKDRLPGLVARIEDVSGGLVTLHRTFVDPELEKRKAVMPVPDGKTILGAAVRLDSILSQTLIVAEGIETALAARELVFRASGQRLTAWATVSAEGMAKLAITPSVRKVLIFGDADGSYTGQTAAYALAKRLVASGVEAEVYLPPVLGMDWLDALVRWRASEKPIDELMPALMQDETLSDLMHAFDARAVFIKTDEGHAGRQQFKV